VGRVGKISGLGVVGVSLACDWLTRKIQGSDWLREPLDPMLAFDFENFSHPRFAVISIYKFIAVFLLRDLARSSERFDAQEVRRQKS
jgi:hypothetical protein